MSILETHRSCPQCGAGLGKKRLWLASTAWAQWDCEACGAALQFDEKRRLLLIPVSLLIMFLAFKFWGRDWLLFAVAVIALFVLPQRFESVRLKGAGKSANMPSDS